MARVFSCRVCVIAGGGGGDRWTGTGGVCRCCGSRDQQPTNTEKRSRAVLEAEALLANPDSTQEQKVEAIKRLNEVSQQRTAAGPSADSLREFPSQSISANDITSNMGSVQATAPISASGSGGAPVSVVDSNPYAAVETRGPAKSMMVNAPRMSEDPTSGLYLYRRIKQLADGGTCIVFKVQLDQHYGKNRTFHACKLLSRANPKIEEISRRLWSIESNMLKKVKSHTNILQLVRVQPLTRTVCHRTDLFCCGVVLFRGCN